MRPPRSRRRLPLRVNLCGTDRRSRNGRDRRISPFQYIQAAIALVSTKSVVRLKPGTLRQFKVQASQLLDMAFSLDPPSYHCALAGSIPTRSDIEPVDIIRVLPFVGLAERRHDGYFWRLIGTAIVEHFGKDHTGEPYGAHFWPPAFVAATTATFDEAWEREVLFF
jgi:hypothetical protein